MESPPNWFASMNLHFVNSTEHVLLQEIWINFIYIPQEQVTQFVQPITWYGGLGMNIAPGTHTVLSNAAISCTAPVDLRVGMMTAHAHASTLRVTTTMNDSTLLFEDYDWAEPTEWRYSRAVQNSPPDAATFQSGGHNRAYDGEMCNVFGYYITPDRNGPNWMCAFF